MNILEELYRGNITPCEKYYEKDSEYAGFAKTVSEMEEKLLAFLESAKASEETGLLERLIKAQGEVLDIGEKERFIEGFRLGAPENVFKDIT